MSTDIRPEVSEKNPYRIEKERYYELLHFCRQYDKWKGAYRQLREGRYPLYEPVKEKGNGYSNPVELINIQMDEVSRNMRMVEECAKKAGGDLDYYIMLAVTRGYRYEWMRVQIKIPCCKDVFYRMYRRFFWELDKVRK